MHNIRVTRLMCAAAVAMAMGVACVGCGSTASSPARHVSSKRASRALPVLRLNYFGATHGNLATTLDPALAMDSASIDTIALTNGNLIHILPNDQVAPDLATWTVAKNRLTYTFTLRKQARFSNGHRVTAADVAFSIERALTPSTGSQVAGTYLSLIQGASQVTNNKSAGLRGLRVLGPRTIQITISRPAGYFLYALASSTADVLDPSVFRARSAAAIPNSLTTNCPQNQGAGPFKFVCTGKHFFPSGRTPTYTLAPNPYYFGRKARITIQLPASTMMSSNYEQYKVGRIDTTLLPPGEIKHWTGSRQLIEIPTSNVSYLTPNTAMPPFSNLHCRLAVSYALDRETIAHVLLHGTSTPAYVIVPHGLLGYYEGRNSEPHFDLRRARWEFSQCPFKKYPVRFTYPTGSADRNRLGAALVNTMTLIGFQARARPLTAIEWDRVVSQPLTRTATQLVRNGWQQDYPDPQDFVSLLLASDAPYNIGGWKNFAFDSLTNQADADGDSARRAQLYRAAQHIALNQGAWIALTTALGHALLKPNIHGLVGTAVYGDLVPYGCDWTNVTIGGRQRGSVPITNNKLTRVLPTGRAS